MERKEAIEIEPTAKNDLALIHTEGLDKGIRCAMCTNSIKSDRGCDGGCVVNNAMYKKVMGVIENHIVDTDKMVEPTTKNNLVVECKAEDYINKRELIQKGMMGCDANGKMLFFIDAKELDSLPSVHFKSEKGYLSIDDVMSVFDDFMCGEVDEEGTETFLEMLKDKAESE